MTFLDIVTEGYRNALPVLLLSAVGGLVAGTILGRMEADLAAVEGLLVMVPAFLAIRGSVYGALGSRLSSALYQGIMNPVFEADRRLRSASVAALLNGVAASLVAALLTYGVLKGLGLRVAPLIVLVIIALVAGVLAGIALTAVIVGVVFVGFRRGYDTDALIGPTMTTVGDVLGMAALFFATRIALAATTG